MFLYIQVTPNLLISFKAAQVDKARLPSKWKAITLLQFILLQHEDVDRWEFLVPVHCIWKK